jgi:hypothetical protein
MPNKYLACMYQGTCRTARRNIQKNFRAQRSCPFPGKKSEFRSVVMQNEFALAAKLWQVSEELTADDLS